MIVPLPITSTNVLMNNLEDNKYKNILLEDNRL